MILGFLAHQRFAVGQRDLIVIRVDFVEGQEAMAIAAILNKGGLQRWLYAGDLGEIDIPAKLFAVLAFEIEFFNAVSVDHNHARLFGVGCVDQHSLGHKNYLHGARGHSPGAAGVWDERARHPARRRQRHLGRPWGRR